MNCSMSPFRLSIRVAAVSAAYPASLTFPVHRVIPSAPWSYNTDAARIASEPKIVASAESRSACVFPSRAALSCPATEDMPTNCPDASYAEIPRASIILADSFVGFANRSSIVRNDVPASDPSRPADANAASVPVVSSNDRPIWEATSPDCFNAIDMSETSPCAFPAAAASRSATWGTSSPCSLNWVSAVAAISAADATSSPPAAARSRAPDRPPLRMSWAETPALARFSMPPAASEAENAVAAPASIAASRSWSREPRASSPVAATWDMASSKFAVDRSIANRPAAAARPIFPAVPPSWSIADRARRVLPSACSMDFSMVLPKSLAVCMACIASRDSRTTTERDSPAIAYPLSSAREDATLATTRSSASHTSAVRSTSAAASPNAVPAIRIP